MAYYKYKARDKTGRVIKGTMYAEHDKDVSDKLSSMGYIPVTVKEEVFRWKDLLARLPIFRGVRDVDFNVFTRQLSSLIKAGLPMLTSLKAIREQTKSAQLKKIIDKLIRQIEEGASISKAFSQYPDIFSDLYVNMIKTGESSGKLDEVLSELARLGEKQSEIKRRIKSSTRYPLITFFVLCAAFIVIVTFVIPRFASIFAMFDTPLPLPTRMLIQVDIFVRKHGILFLISFALLIAALRLSGKSKRVRRFWDGLKLQLPVFGKLAFNVYMARFTRTSAMLVKSGVDILKTLDLVAGTIGNKVFQDTILEIREGVSRGERFSEQLSICGLFTPMVVQMVSIGEETGQMDELLMSAAEYYEEEVDLMVKNMTTLIEPVFIFVLAIFVGLLATAIFLPLWNMISLYTS